MKSWSRLLIFALAFTIDVKIHAEDKAPERDSVKMNKARGISSERTIFHASDNFEHIMQQPAGCVIKESKCAVFNKSNSFTMKVGENFVTLARGASVIRVADNQILLMAGAVFIRATGPFKVGGANGAFLFKEGEALIEKNKERVVATGISADLLMEPRGHKRAYELPIGFSNWVTAPGTSGKAGVGIPQAANIQWVVETWAGLYEGRAETLKKNLIDYKAKWQMALDATGPWHKKMIDRRIAEVEAWRARQAKLRAQREAENARLRELFRQRNYY